MKKLLLLLLLISSAAFAQNTKDTSTQTIAASGGAVTFNNPPGSGTLTFEYTFSGSPSGVSITLRGCMQGGTCSTLTPVSGATNPYTGTTAATVTVSGGYAYYTVTATYTGTATVTVSEVGIQAKAGGGGSGNATTVNGAAVPTSAPLTGTNSSGQFIPVNSTTRTWLKNSQLDIESTVSSTAYGIYNYGDSITCYQGATANTNGYASLIAQDYGLAVSSLPPNNYCTSGDNAGDQTFRMFNSPLNPTDTGNPIVTTAIGTNNGGLGAGQVTGFQQAQYAATAWASLSTTNKILAGNVAVTQAGTWAADTTFTNANGLSTSTGGSTLTYTAQVGTSGAFYIWFRNIKAGPNGVFSVTVDGSPATDTITNSTAVQASAGLVANNAASSVGLARFVTTAGSHTVVVSYTSGTIYILGFGFPPTTHYRGVSAPKAYVANVPPQQNNANSATVAAYNAATQSVISTLSQTDGLQDYFVDVNASIDPILDMAGTVIQNCPASTNPGLHPNNCGMRHEAQAFEATINASLSPPNSNIIAPLNTAGIPTITNMATQGNGLDTGQYSSGGTAFPKGTWCVMAFSGLCQGITASGSGGGPWKTYVMANSTNGRIVFAFPAPNSNMVAVNAADKGGINSDNSWNLPNVSSDTAGNVATAATFTQGTESIAFSATPVYNGDRGTTSIVLSNNITSSTISNPSKIGVVKCFDWIQDATGSRTNTPPTNLKGYTAIGTTALGHNRQCFQWDGSTNWYANAPGVINMLP